MTAAGEPVSALDVLRAIDQLRRDLSGYHGQLKAHDDLQRHCDNQRMRIGELERLYAGAKAERDEALTAYVREYDRANFLVGEKAKLRELVKDMWPHVRHRSGMCQECELQADCRHSPEPCLLYAPMKQRMHELGIEVES